MTAPATAFEPPRDILQDQLAAVWERVLRREPVGIDDDFWRSGGTPDGAAAMFAEVHRVCGHLLAWSDVEGPPTIRSLADRLVAMLPPDRLLQIQAGDPALPPLFVIHGDLSGGGYYVRELARHLDPRQPVFVLQQHGLHGEDVPPSLEAMAADHVATLSRCLPHGQFYLFGHCNGAIIALEVARRLALDGRTPVTLMMSEPPLRVNPNEGAQIPLPQLPASRRQVPRVRGPWLFSVYFLIVLQYRLPRYAGRVAVFWARHGVDTPEARLLVYGVAPHAEMHTVPGTHVSALGRGVSRIAAAARAYLPEPVLAAGAGQ